MTVSSGTDKLLSAPTAESASSAYQLSISTIIAGDVLACKQCVGLTCSSLSTEGRDGALPFPHGAPVVCAASSDCASTADTGLAVCSLLKSVILGKKLKN